MEQMENWIENLPWVVVAHPGTEEEKALIDFRTFKRACAYVRENSTTKCPMGVMKRLEDGTLTTEF